jgi:hypothetical protein
LNLLLLVPAAVLLTLGAEGLYHALISRESVAIDCAEFARARPRSHRLLVTGCEIDYAGAGYRESGGEIQEIYLPARPRGRAIPAPLVVATRDAAALTAFGAVRTVTPQQSVAVLEKVAGLLQVTRAIDGSARAGLIEGLRSRRILSGLTAPVAEDAVIVDVNGTPDFMRPLLALTAGLVLAVLPLARRKLIHRTPDSDWNTPDPSVPGTFPAKVPATFPATFPAKVPAPVSEAVRLPKLLLLSLDVTATPDAIESAPPLGERHEVIQILTGVVPDLEAQPSNPRLARPDGSLTLDLGAHDPIATVVVDARGEAGVALVKELILMTGWRAFAPKTGLFVTVDELTAIGALASQPQREEAR